MSPVAELQGRDVASFRIGDEAGVPESLDRVEQGELGAGVGTLPSHDQPGLLRPGGQRDQVGEFDHPGAVTNRTIGLSGRDPVLLLDQGHGITYSLVNRESDGEVAVGREDRVHESVGGPSRVGSHQDGVDDEGGMVVGEVTNLVLLG